jgi:uncharacterized lipoprotein
MKKILGSILLVTILCNLNACMHNKEDGYLKSQSNPDLKMPANLYNKEVTEDYAIPPGPMADSKDGMVTIIPPDSVLEKSSRATGK